MKSALPVDAATFRRWLSARAIRPACLEDVWGTHHNRRIWAHPRTRQPYVAVSDGIEAA